MKRFYSTYIQLRINKKFLLLSYMLILTFGAISQPIAHYAFNGNADDLSDNGLDGAVVNAALTVDRFGTPDAAYSFNNSSSYLLVPHDPIFDFGTEKDISFSGWFKAGPGEEGIIFDKSDGNTGFILRLQDDGTLLFRTVEAAVTEMDIKTVNAYNDGSWHHFAVVVDRDAGTAIYMDGALDDDNLTTTLFNFDTPEDLLFGVAGGVDNAGLNTFFGGAIDDIRVYDYYIDEATIQSLYEEANTAAVPQIDSFSPLYGSVGAEVIISGKNFDSDSAGNQIYFGAVKAIVSAATDTVLTTTVPEGATFSPVTVLANGFAAYSDAFFSPTFDHSGDGLLENSFELGTTLTGGGTYGNGVAFGDFDGDGLPDIVAADESNHLVSIYQNAIVDAGGSLSFENKVDFSTSQEPRSVAVADYNADGKLDIAVASVTADSITVHINNQSAEGVISFDDGIRVGYLDFPEGISAGDFDQDGKVDLIVGQRNGNSVTIFKNSTTEGVVSFSAGESFTVGQGVNDITIGDFDQDSLLDIAAVNVTDGTFSILRNTSLIAGSLSFATAVTFQAGATPLRVDALDIDNDGHLDIAICNDEGAIGLYRNNSSMAGEVAFDARLTLALNNISTNMSVGDLDGDGKVDLVAVQAGTPSSLAVLRNTSTSGNVSFEQPLYINSDSHYALAVGDLNRDGQPELVAANSEGGLEVYENKVGKEETTVSEDQSWMRTIGSTSADFVEKVEVDSAGNVFITGYFQFTVDFGGQSLSSSAGYDAFLAKYDPKGNLLWVNQMSSTSNAYAYDLKVDQLGNVIAVGVFQGTVNIGGEQVTSSGASDIYITKFDPNGNLLWKQTGGGIYSEYAYGLDIDTDGNVYATGYFSGTASFGGTDVTSSGGDDVFLLKYSSSGVFQWVRSGGDTSTDRGYDVSIAPNGQIIMVGSYRGNASFGGISLNGVSSDDQFVVSYSPEGSVNWAKGFGGSSSDAIRAVDTDATGNIYTAGYLYSTLSIGGQELTSNGNYDIIVTKWNASGEPIWSVSGGSTNIDMPYDLKVSDDSLIHVIGYGSSGNATFGWIDLESTSSADVFQLKLDAAGNFIAASSYGGSSSDQGNGIALDHLGNVISVGYLQGTATFGDTTVTSAGSVDGFIWKKKDTNPPYLAKEIPDTTFTFGFSEWAIDLDDYFNVVTGDLTYQVSSSASGVADVELDGDSLRVIENGFGETVITIMAQAESGDSLKVTFDLEVSLWEWAVSGGGTSNDMLYQVKKSSDGVLVAGSFAGTMTFHQGTTDEFSLVALGGNDAFVVKYDLDGHVLWGKSGGGASNDLATDLEVGNDGSVYLAGYFTSNVQFSGLALSSLGLTDVFLVKYDADGNILWVKSGGSTSTDIAGGLAIDQEGFVHLLGRAVGNMTAGGQSVGSGMFVMTHNSSGQFESLFQLASTGVSQINEAQVSGDQLFVSGNINTNTQFGVGKPNELTVGPIGSTDVFIAKFNRSGGFEWVRTVGGASAEDAGGLAVDPAGNVYISGSFQSTASFAGNVLNSDGSTDGFVVKYNSDGGYLWVKKLGNTGSAKTEDVAFDPLGNLVFTGNYSTDLSIGGDTILVTQGSQNAFVTKLTTEGNLILAQSMPIASAVSLDTNESGQVFVGGYFSSPLGLGGSSLTSEGSNDFFLAKLLNENPDANYSPVVSNPVGDQTFFQGFATAEVDISDVFTDANGDALTYTVTSSNEGVVTVSLEGGILTITEVALGESLITLTADDGNGATGVATFNVFVENPVDQMTAYYTFTDSSPNDQSGNGYNGTFNGNVFNTMDRYGTAQSAMEVRNDGAYFSVNHEDAWDLSGNITLAAWIRPNVLVDDPDEYWDQVFGGIGNLYVDPSGRLAYHWQDPTNSEFRTINSRSGILSKNKWSYITLTIDDQSMLRMYVNGVQLEIAFEETQTFTNEIQINRPVQGNTFYLSNNSTDATDNRWFDGHIDDVRVYAGATLNQEQISGIYQSELSGGEDRLIVDFRFNETSGSTANSEVNDYVGTFKNATGTQNGSQPATDRFGNNTALYFDNIGHHIEVTHERTINLHRGFTLNMWIAPSSFAQEGELADALIEDGTGGRIMIGPSGELYYHYPTNGGVDYPIKHSISGIVNLNNWQMVTYSVNDSGQLKMYHNGDVVELDGGDGAFEPTADVSDYYLERLGNAFIIAPPDGNGTDLRYYHGSLDDVSIYQRVLSDAEVANLYEEQDGSLLAYYPFSGNANDLSNYGKNGTVNGATLTEDRNGAVEQAYLFGESAENTSIDLPKVLTSPTNELTLMAWINPTETITARNAIIEQRGGEDFQFEVQEDGTLYFSKWDESGVEAQASQGQISAVNTWHHVAVSYNGAEASFYVNGELVGAVEMTGSIRSASNDAIIGMAFDGSEVFNGAIDEVRAYRISLNESEIQSIYNTEVPKADWQVYEANELPDAANPAWIESNFNNTNIFWTIEDDPDVSGNKLLAMDAMTSEETAMYKTDDFNPVPTAYTMVMRVRQKDAAAERLTDMDMHINGLRDQLNINSNGQLTLQRSGESVDLAGTFDPMVWNVFRMTVDASSGTEGVVNVYLNEGNTPVLTATTTTTTTNNYVRFGDGYSLSTYSCYTDFVTHSALGALSPTELPLPEGLLPPMVAPEAATDLVAKVTGPNSVRIFWTDVADNETAYSVEYSAGGSFVGSIEDLPANTQEVMVEGLTTNTSYEFTVVASNQYGSTSSVNVQAIPVQLDEPIVEVTPTFFTLNDEITLTFFPNRSYPQSDLTDAQAIYFHSGLVPVGSENGAWDDNTVVGNWGMDDGVGELTNNGDGSWSFTLIPTTYYSVDESYEAAQLGMVFRNEDGTLLGKGASNTDIYVDFFQANRQVTNVATFNGTGYLVAQATSANNPSAWVNSSTFTIEQWLDISTFPELGDSVEIFDRRLDDSGNPAYAYMLYLRTPSDQSGPEMVLEITDGTAGSNESVIVKMDEELLGKWVHVAATYDGSQMKVFFNGIEKASAAASVVIPTTAGTSESLYVGLEFEGRIDEQRLWEGARTTQEIRATMNTELESPEQLTGLAGYWKMNEFNFNGTYNTTPDATSNANDLYDAGDAVVIEEPIDLAIENLQVPTSLETGVSFVTEFDIRNNSETKAATGDVVNQVFISTDNMLDESTDVFVGSEIFALNLAALGSEPLQLELELPVVDTGEYYIIVKINVTNSVEENILDNNILASSAIQVSAPSLNAPQVTVQNLNGESFDLTWEAITEASGYEYAIATDAAYTGIVASGNTGNLTVSATGLSVNTTYYYRVRALDNTLDRVSNYFEGSVTTPDQVSLDAPSNLSAENMTSTSFDLSWSAVTGASAYEYEVADNASFSNTLSNGSITETAVTIVDLNANTTYYYRVRAVDDQTFSDYASGQTTTLPVELSAPTGVSANNVSSSGFTVSWDAVTGANDYEFDISSNSGFTAIVNSDVTTSTSVEITGLNASTVYYFRVRARDNLSNVSDYTQGSVTTSPQTSDAQSPNVSVSSPSQKLIPQDVTLTITTSDNIGVSRVALYKWGAASDIPGQPSETINASTISPNQDFEAVLTANDFDKIGVSFFVIAFDEAGNESEPSDTQTIMNDEISQSSQVINNIPVGTSAIDYSILAFPYQSANVNQVFNLPNDPSVWRIATWLGSSYNYNINTLSAGVGYWVLINPDEVSSSQLVFDNVSPITASETFNINLRTGWNQIGNPFLTGLDWPEVLEYNVDKGNLNQGELNTLSTYDNGWTSSSGLDVYEGAFVDADRNITLEIPLTAASSNRVSYQEKSGRAFVRESGGWEMVLDITANSGLRYALAGIGQSPLARDGADLYDIKTPILFDEFLKAEFVEAELKNDQITRSLHQSNNDDVWQMTFSSSYSKGTPITFNFAGFVDLSAGERLVMLDLASGELLEVFHDQVYDFTYQGASNFVFIKGSADFVQSELTKNTFQIGAIFPNPTEGDFNIPVNIPQFMGEVLTNCEVSDLSGRVVYKQSMVLSPSDSYIPMDFTDRIDESGIYFIKLSIAGKTQSFTQKVFLKPAK